MLDFHKNYFTLPVRKNFFDRSLWLSFRRFGGNRRPIGVVHTHEIHRRLAECCTGQPSCWRASQAQPKIGASVSSPLATTRTCDATEANA